MTLTIITNALLHYTMPFALQLSSLLFFEYDLAKLLAQAKVTLVTLTQAET